MKSRTSNGYFITNGWFFAFIDVDNTWPYHVHFQLDKQVWPLDRIFHFLHCLSFATHGCCHIKFHKHSLNAKVVRGDDKMKALFLCKHLHSPCLLCWLFNMEWCQYAEHIVHLIVTHVFWVYVLGWKFWTVYCSNKGIQISKVTT